MRGSGKSPSASSGKTLPSKVYEEGEWDDETKTFEIPKEVQKIISDKSKTTKAKSTPELPSSKITKPTTPAPPKSTAKSTPEPDEGSWSDSEKWDSDSSEILTPSTKNQKPVEPTTKKEEIPKEENSEELDWDADLDAKPKLTFGIDDIDDLDWDVDLDDKPKPQPIKTTTPAVKKIPKDDDDDDSNWDDDFILDIKPKQAPKIEKDDEKWSSDDDWGDMELNTKTNDDDQGFSLGNLDLSSKLAEIANKQKETDVEEDIFNFFDEKDFLGNKDNFSAISSEVSHLLESLLEDPEDQFVRNVIDKLVSVFFFLFFNL